MHIIGQQGISEYSAGADETPDGGYAAGGTANWEGSLDCMIVKFNSSGDSIWSRTRGTPDYTEDAQSFIVLPDGRFVFAGYINQPEEEKPNLLDSDAMIMILDANGDHNSSVYYGGDEYTEMFNSVTQSLDSNLVCTGLVDNDDTDHNLNIYKINYDNGNCSGAPLWEVIDEVPLRQTPNCIKPTFDGGYIIVGKDTRNVTYRDQGYVYKTTNCGEVDRLGQIDSDGRVTFESVVQLPDSSIVIAGLISYDVHGSNYDLILLKYNQSLTEHYWTKYFGGAETDEYATSIDLTPDGGFVVGGVRQIVKSGKTDLWILRFTADGDTLWTKTLGTSKNDMLSSIKTTSDGGYLLCGTTDEKDNLYRSDLMVIKLAPKVLGIEEKQQILPSDISLFQNYPNPFNSITNISYSLKSASNVKITIYDATGKRIYTLIDKNQQPAQHNVKFNGTNLTSGVYYYQLETDFQKQTRKMILMR